MIVAIPTIPAVLDTLDQDPFFAEPDWVAESVFTFYSLFAGVTCQPLQSPVNGWMSPSSNPGFFLYLQSSDFGCNNGYFLDGPKTRRCLANGQWSGRKEPNTCEGTAAEGWALALSVSVKSKRCHYRILMLGHSICWLS